MNRPDPASIPATPAELLELLGAPVQLGGALPA